MEIERKQRVITADEVFDLVRDDLLGVEKAIETESFTSAHTVRPISEYLQQNGSERLCAALLLLCARIGGGGGRLAIQLGAVVEMMHAAALVHRETIADQPQRGRSQPHVQRSNSLRVLAGDWLYLGAFRVAQQERVLHLVIGVAQMMATADLIQHDHIGCIDLTEADCIELVDHKTACLFSVCGRLGAVASGVDSRDVEKLSEFAWNLGMAFQLIDDMLDFSQESTPDKPAGGDLKDGKVTLPMVYALQQASLSERDLVAVVLRDRRYDAVPFAYVLELVHRYGGFQRTSARARVFTDRARQIVFEFPESRCRRALLDLTELFVKRGC